MKTELYQKLFTRMDELGVVRKDLTFGCKVKQWNYLWSGRKSYWKNAVWVNEDLWMVLDNYSDNEIIWHPPVLSDCIYAIERIVSNRHWHWEYLANVYWDFRKPYLNQQSDELGEKLLKLLY